MKFYCVKDSSGNPIAYFYFDPFSRPSEKREGAWMDEVVSRSRVFSPDGTSPRLPVAHMVCNQMPPVGDKPNLVTFQEVSMVAFSSGHWIFGFLNDHKLFGVASNISNCFAVLLLRS